MLQLPSVAQDYRQLVFGFDFDPNVVPALLVSNQTRSPFDYFIHVDRHSLPGTQATEIEQAIGDRFATKSFIPNQPEIFTQITGVRRIAKRAFLNSLLQRLCAGGDGRQRIIDFVDDTRSQTSYGGEFLCARDCTMSFDACGYVLANGNHMRNLFRFAGTHRNLADQPMIRVTFIRDGFLLDTVNLAGRENLAELTFEQLTILFGEHFKNVLAENESARQTEFTQLAVAVPGDDSIFTIDRVERQRQRVDDRFGEALLHFGFRRAAIDFLGKCRGGLARLQI